MCAFSFASSSHSSPPRKRISLSLADLPRPSFLVLLLQQLGGGGRCTTYFTCVGVVSLPHKNIIFGWGVCVCHRIGRFIKKNPFLFFSLFFLLLHWWGGFVVLVLCVFERERKSLFVCSFVLVGFVE